MKTTHQNYRKSAKIFEEPEPSVLDSDVPTKDEAGG